mmetsp:Transcript_12144/g.20016  ORF Transcript_12144/g.20016 Transcript_12144/m.20016 type:complete len:92 (+) Transcript_12144:447-722(+)
MMVNQITGSIVFTLAHHALQLNQQTPIRLMSGSRTLAAERSVLLVRSRFMTPATPFVSMSLAQESLLLVVQAQDTFPAPKGAGLYKAMLAI